MKRFLSFLLVVVLLFSLAIPAFADVPIVGAETVSPATAFGAETVEPVIGAPAVDAVEVPASAELALSAPAMGEPFAVADNSALPSAILSNIPPNTPVEYTVDGVKHSFFYLFTPPLPPQGYLVEWYLDDSRVFDGSFGYSCGNRGLNFDFVVNLRKTNGFFIPSFGYSHTHDDGTFCNRLDIYNTENFSNIKIPLNAVIDGVENPNPDLGGNVTLGEFSNILDNYIIETCAPNGDTIYDLERLNGTTVDFSYRNSYGSGSNVISFKGGYVYVNGAKYDFNKNAVDKKKVFGIGKSGIIDTIFGDYDVVTKHIVKLDTDKDAKVVLVKKEHFGSYTFDDFPITYSIRPAGTPSPEPDLGDDKTNGFDGDYGVKILMPHNGFKQSKLNAITTKIYYKIPFNGDETKHNIKVSGYVGDSRKTVAHTTNKLENNTIIEGYLDVLGAVNWNTTTPITITVTDYTGKVYTCSVNVLCYSDFVDNDGDGLDDRTNQDEWTGSPDLNKPLYPDNSPPEGANVIEWFKWFAKQPAQFFDTLKSGFDSVIGYGADFSNFLGSAFSYLPNEISVVIGLGFTALVFLRIFGR